mmetsp:Transcript_26024/g.59509  ORF Transcript_26024/g.59509 Transcript_26024/m.59509 type:complete len:312 (-) Transcript_26024:490-1425(-)
MKVTVRIVIRWTANCPAIETSVSLESGEDGGLLGDSLLNGLPRVTKRNMPATTSPSAVICRSPCFTPAWWRAVRTSAVTRQFTPRILYICSIVTSAQRPCWRMSRQQRTLVLRVVKGEATDAFPRLTKSSSSSASASALSDSSTRSALDLRPALPPLADFLPPASVFFFLFFFLSSALTASSVSLAALCFFSTSGTLMMETPTWAFLRAPTSFVPSPQNSVCLPASLNAATTASLCLGACLAKTETSGTRSASAFLAAGSWRTCRSSSEEDAAAERYAPPPPAAESPKRVRTSPVAQNAADPRSLIFLSAA